MPHDIIGYEAAGIAAVSPVLVAVADPAALELVPLSAGVSGAIVAALRQHLNGNNSSTAGVPVNRWRWASTLVTGILAAFFITPALTDQLGLGAARWQIFAHFATGMLGSNVCDLLLANGNRLSEWVLKVFGGKLPDVPKGPLPGGGT